MTTEPILLLAAAQAALQALLALVSAGTWLRVLLLVLLAAVTAVLQRGRVRPAAPARELPAGPPPPPRSTTRWPRRSVGFTLDGR